MKRVLLIIGCVVVPLLYLGLAINQTVRAVERMPAPGADECRACGPTVHIEQGLTAVTKGGGPSINFSNTVDMDPGTCASSDVFTLPPGGGTVFYCYYVENDGDVTLNLHTVVDNQYGILLGPGYNVSLGPGAVGWFTYEVHLTQTTYNSSTWESFNPGPADVVSRTDSALVIVESEMPITALTATNDGPTYLGRPTGLSAVIEGGGNESYAWNFGDGLTGTGALTSHIYPGFGVYTAVVTATNSINSLTATTTVTVHRGLYLPAVLRN